MKNLLSILVLVIISFIGVSFPSIAFETSIGPINEDTTKTRESLVQVVQITETFKNVAYTIYKNPKRSWLGSLQYCVQHGGHLVDITTDEEHEFVLNLTIKAMGSDKTSPWTGGNDINEETKYKWTRTEEPVNVKYFENKRDIKANLSRHCVAFKHYTRTPFKLTPLQICKRKTPFICKFLRSF